MVRKNKNPLLRMKRV